MTLYPAGNASADRRGLHAMNNYTPTEMEKGKKIIKKNNTYGKNVQKLDMNAQFWSLMPNFER